MKRTLLLACISAIAAGLAPAVSAQAPGGPHGPGHVGAGHGGPGPAGFGLLQFDANADGRLTRAEFDAAQKARFDEIDADKDGSATREEMRAAMKAGRDKAQKARFTALDTDRNGQLSESELKAAPEGGPRGRGPGGPRGGPGKGDHAQGERIGGDADKDGEFTFAEFTARPSEMFTRADANKDGVVTIAELQANAPGMGPGAPR